MKIRNAISGNAEMILALHADTVRRVNAGDYRFEQINAWLGKQSLDRVQKLIVEKRIVVALDDADRVIGFATRLGNEIHGMYVSADHLRQGIASALFGRVEADAQTEGLRQLVAESTLAAVPFYSKMGFVEVKRKHWPLTETLSLEVVVMNKDIRGQEIVYGDQVSQAPQP